MVRFYFAILVFALAACSKEPAPVPQLVTVAVPVKPVVPSECKQKNPPKPVGPADGTSGAIQKDRGDLRRTVLKLEALRDACASSLAKQ